MLALVKRSEEDVTLALEEREPVEPGPDEVRVRVAACGVCGTDLHIADGSYRSRPPVTLGHEVAGTVTDIGEHVDPAWMDAAVALSTFVSTCGQCVACLAGRPNLCADRVSIGSGADGGFAESLVVPAANLHRLPEGLPIELGALAEPLACVCQSLLDPARVQPGDRVLVLGPGPVGLLAAQVARHVGASVTVAGIERDASRLAAAAAMGFATVRSDALPPDPVWDVAIECSGAGPAMALALEVLRPGGGYVQMGQTNRPVHVRLALVSFKELELSGGFASTPRSWARAMRLLASGAVDLAALVTAVAPLGDWRRVFERTANAEGLKYLLAPGVR